MNDNGPSRVRCRLVRTGCPVPRAPLLLGSVLVRVGDSFGTLLVGLGLCLRFIGVGVDDLLLGLFVGLDHGLLGVVGRVGGFFFSLGRCLGAVFRIGLGYLLVGLGDFLVSLGLRVGFL